MTRALAAALAASLALAPTARADFVISGQPAAEAPSPAPADGEPNAGQPQRQASAKCAAARFGIANGFGDQVPLAFAVRQIVPPGVAVRYGPGASSDATVTWRGGSPWNQVLQAAVRPLGLKVLLRPALVEIRQ